jgi:RNA polymerase sigma-B factor
MSPASRRRRARTLARRVRGGDRRARDELVALHMPLARALALRYRRSSEPLDDLMQVAYLGLVKAVDRWDPDRGPELSSYAAPTILGELRRHFRDCTWGIRPPRGRQELSLAAERARNALQAELGRPPTVAELAARLGRAERVVTEALLAGAGRWLPSLDAPVDGDDARYAGDLIPCVDRELERVEQRATIERLTGILDEHAREVLRLRFAEDLLQDEIAARTGSTQVQVSRVLRSSLQRLHAYAAAA